MTVRRFNARQKGTRCGSLFSAPQGYNRATSITAPLTNEQLHAIGARRTADPDVLALLSEIKRLRAMVVCADQRQRSLGNLGDGADRVLSALLDGEPCVAELVRLPRPSSCA